MSSNLGIEGMNVILDKVVCPPCQEACTSYIEQLDYSKCIPIHDVNKIYLSKQSGKQFEAHECERLEEGLCFCNAHESKDRR